METLTALPRYGFFNSLFILCEPLSATLRITQDAFKQLDIRIQKLTATIRECCV
ncbi:hypothetical protein O979_09150 [Mycobacterium avium subsp. paratuberculosis 10-4404]|nr:hypothetical protein O979_09150 [Mycobacterium avium subsp. paratuberculosis 10-4404]ETB04881.1 hypothetical protein O978_09185 [Mycobacterium avium subsp. paratuberculosis 10-5864]ETB12503.1 hypothetical protein O980_08820 [Mycobacterium avium subsp. paratuberculosis 08-8281]ETB33202.1 hypothetical protein O977_09780 [Mycobacterium avium subsp. paratuberculosis 10-5975]ETB40696.1 hypothetical protein O975_09910 [Mycobacterium avium subsp. paratuberculosis 11-1786]ETB52591.1 hypothetical pr